MCTHTATVRILNLLFGGILVAISVVYYLYAAINFHFQLNFSFPLFLYIHYTVMGMQINYDILILKLTL